MTRSNTPVRKRRIRITESDIRNIVKQVIRENIETARKNNLVPAPVDEKNVCTDWIDSLFDDVYKNVQKGHEVIIRGEFSGSPMVAKYTYGRNTVSFKTYGDDAVYAKLKSKLNEYVDNADDPSSSIQMFLTNGRDGELICKFYFVEDI